MVGQVVQFMCYHHRHRPANHSIHALLGLVRLWSKHWVDWYTFILFRCNKLFHFVCNVYTDVKKRITVFKVAYSYFLLYNMNSTRSIGLIQESTQLHLPPDKQGWANKNRQGQNCKSNMLLYRYICIYLYMYTIFNIYIKKEQVWVYWSKHLFLSVYILGSISRIHFKHDFLGEKNFANVEWRSFRC